MSHFRLTIIRIGNKLKMFVLNRDFAVFCLFLLFASMLWLGHALHAVRERKLSFAIEYKGVPDEVEFEQALPERFVVTVRDQGKRLRSYRSENLAPIVIDLSAQMTADHGTVHISAEQMRGKITDQLQGTAKLQRIIPEQIVADYYKQASKVLPVVFCGELMPATQYVFREPMRIVPQQIMVYGRAEVLDTLRALYTEPMVFQAVKDSFEQTVPLQAQKGVRPVVKEVTLQTFAEQFTEKRFSLPIETQGVPEGERLRVFENMVEVVVTVGVASFSKVEATDFKAVCTYPQEPMNTLPIEIHYTSPYVMSARVIPAEAEFVIEKKHNDNRQ